MEQFYIETSKRVDDNFKLEKVDIVDRSSISDTRKNDFNIVLTSRS